MRRSLALVVMASTTARMVALVVGELAEVGEAGAEGVAGGVQGTAGRVGDDEVVDAGVEGLGEADDGFEAGATRRFRSG
jgi:hypothetical protein